MKQTLICCALLLLIANLNAQIATIPFTLEDNGFLFLKVKLNDQNESLNFIFDTGATADLIDSTAAVKLNLKADYQQEVQGAGGTKEYDMILGQQLAISNIQLNDVNFVISNLNHLNEMSDQHIDGIIGYSLLRKYITKIDYENQQMLIFNSISDVNTNGFETIPFQFENDIPIPQFEISAVLHNCDTVKGMILFDSGAGLSLIVNTPFNKKYNISQSTNKRVISKSADLTSESILEEIAIEALHLGSYHFKDIPILIAHTNKGVNAFEGYLGILGAGIIKRFNIILDYESMMLYLKPNSIYSDLFRFPLSGIQLKKKDGNICINHVAQISPAFQLGIQEGDQILSINGDKSLNIKQYRKYLKEISSEAILEIIQSDGKVKTFNIPLKRLL